MKRERRVERRDEGPSFWEDLREERRRQRKTPRAIARRGKRKGLSSRYTVYAARNDIGVLVDTSLSSDTQALDIVLGSTNPFHKQQIASGLNATTNLNATQFTFEAIDAGLNQAQYRTVNSPNGQPILTCRLSGIYSSLNFIPTHPFSVNNVDSENAALSSFYEAVRQVQQQMSGPTFLGELRETVEMIRKPAKGIFDSARRYLDRIDRGARKARSRAGRIRYIREAAAAGWLELSFGWKPLISDVKEIATTIARWQYDVRHTVVRGFGKSEQHASTVADTGGFLYHWNGTLSKMCVQQNICVIRGAVHARTDAPYSEAQRLLELSGFNLREFVPTVWNLLPFSFLIDYFVNVGDVLESRLTDTSSIKWAARTIVTLSQWHNRVTVTSNNPANLLSLTGNGHLGETRVARRDVSRNAVASFLPLDLTFSIPGKGSQYANMGALLYSIGSDIVRRHVN